MTMEDKNIRTQDKTGKSHTLFEEEEGSVLTLISLSFATDLSILGNVSDMSSSLAHSEPSI